MLVIYSSIVRDFSNSFALGNKILFFGLIIAEIELKSEQETFEKPDWLGEEVTNDEKYYNAYLSKNPYKNW